MIIKKNEMRTEKKLNVHNGEGEADLRYLVEKEHLIHSRLLANMVLQPGASVGVHGHTNETEFYIFISGNGIAIDDGKEVPVGPGDVLVTSHGHSHGLKNTGSNELKFIVLVNCSTDSI